MTSCVKWVRVSLQGLFRVTDSGPWSQAVIPAKAGIQDILSTAAFWIPALAGMTD